LFGTNRPAIIAAVEKRLWRALFDIAFTSTPFFVILTQALDDVKAMLSANPNDPQIHAKWFSAGPFKLELGF
jgi:hypothetical protein